MTTDVAGTVRADETPLQCITRCCTQLEALHGATTITGSRARDLTRDIRQAAQQLADELRVCGDLLLDAQEDLQSANEGA